MATRTVSVRLQAEIGQYVSGMTKAALVTKGLGESAEQSSKKTRSGFDLAGKGALLLGGAVAATLIGVVTKSMEFEKAMSAASAATQETGAALGDLREAALKAGAATQYSATEAAQAITEMGKAGVSTADILDGGLAGALDLAAAGQLDVAQAAGIASVAMTQFKLSGDQLPHVADLLAAGAGKAMGSVDDLGMALNQAGLVASSTGLSIEETTGTLSAFASAGLIGSDAGTSFRSMLQHLQNPSKESAAAMAALGISMYDANGAFVGMESLAGQLQTRMTGLTQAERDKAMATIFGSDAVRAANVLYTQGADGIAEWTKKVNDAGYAQEQAAKLTDNLAGDLERLGGAFDTLLISMGSGAQGPLRSLVQGLTDLIDGTNELGSEIGGRLSPFLSSAADIGGDLWEILSDLLDTVGPLAIGMGKLAGGAIIGSLNALAEVLSEVTGFLADNEEVAFALAAVLAVQLAGGIGAVTVAFNRMVLTPVVLGLANVLGGAGGLATFLTGGFTAAVGTARTALMGLLTAVAPLAAVAAVTYMTVSILKSGEAADDARDEIAAMWDAVEKADSSTAKFDSLSDNIETLRERVSDLKVEMETLGVTDMEFGASDAFANFFNPTAKRDADAAIASYQEYTKALEQARDKQTELVRTATVLGNQFGLNRQQVLDLADKYNVDLTQGTQNAYLQFQRFYNTDYGPKIAGAVGAVASFTDQMATTRDTVSEAQQEIDDFKLSLDILTGAHVSMLEAQMALGSAIAQGKDAMTELGGEVLNASGALNDQSENGRKAADVLLGVRDSGDLLIATMKAQGATEEDLLVADAGLRDSFIQTAMQMGIGEGAANALADEILGIPAERHSNITVNTDQATQAVTSLNGKIDLLAAPRYAVINFRAIMPDLNGAVSGSGRMGSYASGGTPRAGEVALVGEKGPEIVRFGAAATVYTASETRAMLSGRETSPVLRGREFSGASSQTAGGPAIDYGRLAEAVAAAVGNQPTLAIGSYNEARQSPHDVAEAFAWIGKGRG